MAYLSEGQKQLNVRIPEDINDVITTTAKENGMEKGAYVTTLIQKALSEDGYKADLDAAGASKDDLAQAKVQLDKVYDTVKNLINKVETAKDVARKDVQKELELRIKEIDRLKAKLAEAEDATKTANELWASKNSELQNTQAELSAAIKNTKEAMDKADILEKSLADKEELLSTYKMQAEGYAESQRRIAHLERTAKETQDKLTNIMRESTEKDAQIKRVSTEKDAQISALESKNRSIYEDLEAKNNEIRDLEHHVDRLNLQIEKIPDMEAKIRDLTNQLDKSRIDLMENIKNAANTLAERLEEERSKARNEADKHWREVIDRLVDSKEESKKKE